VPISGTTIEHARESALAGRQAVGIYVEMCDPSVALTETDISILGARDLLTWREIYPINMRGFGTCRSGP